MENAFRVRLKFPFLHLLLTPLGLHLHTSAAVLKGGEEEERIDPLMSFTLGLTAVTSGERKNFSFYTGERSGVLTGKTDWAYRFCEMSQ